MEEKRGVQGSLVLLGSRIMQEHSRIIHEFSRHFFAGEHFHRYILFWICAGATKNTGAVSKKPVHPEAVWDARKNWQLIYIDIYLDVPSGYSDVVIAITGV